VISAPIGDAVGVAVDDDLLAAIRAAPADDAPRLVWADAVGGERGELVVLQCDLARGDLGPAETAARRRRVDALLARHGAAWSGLAPHATRCVFRRGFVEAAAVDAATFTTQGDAIRAAAPLLTAVRVDGLHATLDARVRDTLDGPHPVERVRALFATPAFRTLRGVELAGTFVVQIVGDSEWDVDRVEAGDQVLELIAATGALAGFRAFAMPATSPFSLRGLHELVSASLVPTLERLEVHGSTSPDAIVAICERAPGLRALHLSARTEVAAFAPALPPTLAELALSVFDEADLAALAASPAARGLERLRITGPVATPALARLDAFAQLRALDLGYLRAPTTAPAQAALVGDLAGVAGLATLRELRVPGGLGVAALRTLAAALGPQLAVFDTCAAGLPAAAREALAPLVAGDVVDAPWSFDDTSIHVGVAPREPWLRYGVVSLAT